MLINKKSAKANGIVFMAAGMLLAACGGETPKEETITDTTISDSTVSVEAEKISYSLPSPLKIASIFKKSGIKYKDGVTSQLKDPTKYITNVSKALNLGIYSADLSYTILNKQNQEAIVYMKLSRQMADNLGMGVIYEKNNLVNRFQNNIGKNDSLVQIISELQMITDMYLNENNQKQITSIAFAGAWIESLYIASKVSEKGKEQVFNNKFASQMSILESIINALTAEEKKDPNIPKLIADLQTIKSSYDALPSVKDKNENTERLLSEAALTNDEIASLLKKIEELRTKFING